MAEPIPDQDGEDVYDALDRLEGMLDHIHADVRALRAHLGIPRPECYPEIETQEGRAPRAQEEER